MSEAMDRLKDHRAQQVTLLSILAATRFRIITKEGLVPTMCPRPGCGRKDSFWHMMERYRLVSSVECGPYVVPFLLYLARNIPAVLAPCPWVPNRKENLPPRSIHPQTEAEDKKKAREGLTN